MNKKILALLAVILIAILAIAVIAIKQKRAQDQGIIKQELLQKFELLKSQYEAAKAQGLDVTEAEKLGLEAKAAFGAGDYKRAKDFLFKISDILNKPENPGSFAAATPALSNNPEISLSSSSVILSKEKEKAKEKLLKVKVASHYERITDGAEIPRSIDDVVNIFKETNTELVFRSFWRWLPVPESSNDAIPGVPASLIKSAADKGYMYQQYKDAANKIKEKNPNIILVGAISAQRFNNMEIDPITREVFGQEEIWTMAFDPEKWSLGVSKEETQCKMTKSWHWIDSNISCPSGYNYKNAVAYFPDITNEKYQKFILDIAKKQIDSGSDAIWIDMLFYQASFIAKNINNPNHPAVKAAFEASSKIIDDIHNYGYSKGKYVYVGTWLTFTELPYAMPDVDFVTGTPTSEEVNAGKINEAQWVSAQKNIKTKLGNVPLFMFIDHGNDGLPLAVFSQKLSSAEQNEFLKSADEFFTDNGMVFVYPIHGGFMGQSAKILAFGKLKNYDALAPEFNTYDTIKELADKKSLR